MLISCNFVRLIEWGYGRRANFLNQLFVGDDGEVSIDASLALCSSLNEVNLRLENILGFAKLI